MTSLFFVPTSRSHDSEDDKFVWQMLLNLTRMTIKQFLYITCFIQILDILLQNIKKQIYGQQQERKWSHQFV